MSSAQQSISFICSAIENNDLIQLPRIFDISFINKLSMSFKKIALNPGLISSQIHTKFWADIVENITNISLCDDKISTEENMRSAFQYYNQASIIFLQNSPDIDIRCAVYKNICRTCEYFSTFNLCYQDCCSLLRKLYNDILSSRTRVQIRFNNPTLTIVNSIVKLLLMKNNYNLADKTFISLNQSLKIDPNSYTVSDLAAYYFLKGKIDMVYNIRGAAYVELKKCLEYLPLNCVKDRRLVLVHFIPVCLSYGIVPTEDLLNNYDLNDLYSDFTTAVATGDLALFNQSLNTHQSVLIHFGVWEMIIYSRRMVLRRIMEMVKLHTDSNIVDIEPFRQALCTTGDEFSFDDAILEIANLIYDKLIMANVVYQRKLVVLNPKGNTFGLPNPEDEAKDDE